MKKSNKSSENVKKWRKRTKSRMIESMGGCCQICGYNNSHWALAFHHIDSNSKKFILAGVRANCISWSKIVEELRKCILLCHNCHSEVHHGITCLPKIYCKFNEEYADYRKKNREKRCVICDKIFYFRNKTCSKKCASILGGKNARKRRKILMSDEKIIELKNQNISNIKIAKINNVSETSIRKRLKKLNYDKKTCKKR